MWTCQHCGAKVNFPLVPVKYGSGWIWVCITCAKNLTNK